MRIAHVITRMIVGGAQENTLFCCQDLIELFGDDVVLVTGPALGPEGDLLQQVGAGRVPVHYIPSMRRAIHPARDLVAYRRLKQYLAEFRPDVVHTHSAKGGLLGRMAAWSLRVPVVMHTVHGAPFHAYQNGLARELFRRCEKYAAGKCHRLISVADAMTDSLVQANVAPRDKFVTVYSGMDVEPFLAADTDRTATRRELGFQEDEIVIGKIARLFHLKGHADLIQAAGHVVRQCPAVRFLLVGDGILREQLEAQIRAEKLQDHFVLTGLVPPQRIPALLGAMDILVHVSLREGLARALPQALIAGKPVVSYDVDGAREVVLDGHTGRLVPPRQIDELAGALEQLAQDASLRQRMGQEGRRRFTEQFRHQHMTRVLRDLYSRQLSQSGGDD